MKARVWGAVCVVMVAALVDASAAAATKSKSQVSRDAAWKNRMTERRMETGRPLHDFVFLDLVMGCTRADAERVIRASTNKVVFGKPAEKSDVGDVLTYEGNHKLAKAKSTELTFFEDRLMRVAVVFETENPDITCAALLAGLDAKYNLFEDEAPAKPEGKDGKAEAKSDAKPGPKPKPAPGREFSRDMGGILLSMKVQRGGKGEEVVITALDPEMLERQRETRIEKERASIGDF